MIGIEEKVGEVTRAVAHAALHVHETASQIFVALRCGDVDFAEQTALGLRAWVLESDADREEFQRDLEKAKSRVKS